MNELNEITTPKLVTICTAARMGVASEWALRRWLKEGKLPGVYSGTRFYLNLDAFVRQLDKARPEG